MNILLLGSGGREHALAWKISQSKKTDKLFIAPGNEGTASVGQNVPLKELDFDGIAKFALENDVKMIVVGPEVPLVEGIADYFSSQPQFKEVTLPFVQVINVTSLTDLSSVCKTLTSFGFVANFW